MTEEEKYLFDLCGFILVRNALSDEELTALNGVLDARWDDLHPSPTSFAGDAVNLQGEGRRMNVGVPFDSDQHGKSCRGLLAHPRINPYLNAIIGRGFRLDHPHAFMIQERGCEGFRFHGSTGPEFDPNQYHVVRNGKMSGGLTVVTWQLSDINPGDGGFTLVPGSHKGNFPVPEQMRKFEIFQERFEQIVMKAGDAIIFSETVLHGTLPWVSASPRKSILARYTAANLAYLPYRYAELLESIGDELNDEQKAVLEPPYHTRLERPLIE